MNKRYVTTLNIQFCITGIFIEKTFKYQNAHNDEFGGDISANYGGFFTIIIMFTIWHFQYHV